MSRKGIKRKMHTGILRKKKNHLFQIFESAYLHVSKLLDNFLFLCIRMSWTFPEQGFSLSNNRVCKLCYVFVIYKSFRKMKLQSIKPNVHLLCKLSSFFLLIQNTFFFFSVSSQSLFCFWCSVS